MRTTLTLDEDVAAKLKAEARKSGKAFKEVVNETLRAGFLSSTTAKPTKRFKVKPVDLGLREGLSYDNVWKLIEEIEGQDYQ